MVWKRLTFRGALERDVCSSFPSNRFDMAPLWYVVPLLIELPRSTGSEDGRDWGVPAKYIEAFPFPGRAAGRRLTITEDERGIICESSLCSTVGGTGKYRENFFQDHLPCLEVASKIWRSKSLALPILLASMISRFKSKTDMPVPSKVTRDSSFLELNL